MEKRERFDIVSLLYRSFLDEEELLKAVKLAIEKGANVISIRRVEE
jgi:hypothetical protein